MALPAGSIVEEVPHAGVALQPDHQVAVVVTAKAQGLSVLRPGGERELPRDAEFGIVVRVTLGGAQVAGHVRHEKAVRALWRNQPFAVHEKLVFLGLAADHGMVVQQDAGLTVPAPERELKRRAQAGHPSTHDR